MKVPRFAKFGFGAAAAAGILAACSGGMQPALSPSGLSANYNRSWMTSEKANTPLVYVTDQNTNEVYVLTYPAGKLVSKLTGFFGPEGICADNKGDIFVANADGNNILEYKRGGTSPIATLNDSAYYPKSCAVDPTTGDLAVTNTAGVSNPQGNLAIYKNATGSPTFYSDSSIFYDMFCAYDTAGNLYVDGFTNESQTGFTFAELSKGANALTNVTLNKAPNFPGGVAWDGKHVTVGDYIANIVYRYKIAGSGGTEEGSTPLHGTHLVYQYALWPKDATTMIVPNVEGPKQNVSDLQYYKYPGGGSPAKTIGFGGGFVAYAAISP